MNSTHTIAFITDVHLDEQFPLEQGAHPKANLECVLQDIREQGIRRVIFGGDIGDATSHDTFFALLKDVDLDLMLGNHDRYAQVRTHFARGNDAEELYYIRDEGAYRLIMLDSSVDSLSARQCAWLEQALKTPLEVIVCIHHPVLNIPTAVDRMFPLQNRTQVQDVLFACNKHITLLCAHYHMNDERVERNVTQITTQALSYQVNKDAEVLSVHTNDFGYRILALGDTGITSQLKVFNTEK